MHYSRAMDSNDSGWAASIRETWPARPGTSGRRSRVTGRNLASGKRAAAAASMRPRATPLRRIVGRRSTGPGRPGVGLGRGLPTRLILMQVKKTRPPGRPVIARHLAADGSSHEPCPVALAIQFKKIDTNRPARGKPRRGEQVGDDRSRCSSKLPLLEVCSSRR